MFCLEEQQTASGYFCVACGKAYCFRCRVPYHEGQTCKEFQVSH